MGPSENLKAKKHYQTSADNRLANPDALMGYGRAKEKFNGQYEGRTRDLGVISTTL